MRHHQVDAEPAPMRSNMQLLSVDDLQQADAHRRVKALREALIAAAATLGIEADDISDLEAVCVRAVRVAGQRSGWNTASVSPAINQLSINQLSANKLSANKLSA